MSYVDAFHNKDKDIVHVVERGDFVHRDLGHAQVVGDHGLALDTDPALLLLDAIGRAKAVAIDKEGQIFICGPAAKIDRAAKAENP